MCAFTGVEGLPGALAVKEDVLPNQHYQEDENEGKFLKFALFVNTISLKLLGMGVNLCIFGSGCVFTEALIR